VADRTAAQRLGDSAEAFVASTLSAAGWTVLARNLRVGRHELDLLAIDPGPSRELVAIEVRWRARRDFGLAEETVGWEKRRSMRRGLAALHDRLRSLAPDAAHLPVRFDLIVLEPAPRGSSEPYALRHHRAVEL
jgi:Holliday junction resolvase-like predicted endonuclease